LRKNDAHIIASRFPAGASETTREARVLPLLCALQRRPNSLPNDRLAGMKGKELKRLMIRLAE
jgi:hypothetical protein